MNKFLFGSEEFQEGQNPSSITQANIEKELVVYCRINDFDALQKAERREHQAQYGIKSSDGSPSKGNVRVRKTISGNATTYVMTVKSKLPEGDSEASYEEEVVVDENYYNVFKSLCPDGMIKDRYFFPITTVSIKHGGAESILSVPDAFYEVDVFHKPDGSYHDWCKIDVELDKIEKALKDYPDQLKQYKINLKVGHLPFRPTEAFLGMHATEEQNKTLDNLYKNVFKTKNV